MKELLDFFIQISNQLTFKKLLEKKTVNIHQRNLQTLATEIYRA